MLTRILAAAVALPVFIVLVWLGGMPLNLALGLLAAIAGWELYRSCGIKSIWFYIVFILFVVALASVSVIRQVYDLWLVWLIFIAAWGCDTGAYFVGRAIGKRKLAPVISPKKTVEGAIGGVVIAASLCVLYALILNHFEIWLFDSHYYLWFAAFGAFGAVLGQAGDLSASAVKRKVGIKDYGNIMPGHGGVLDRFDSIIFVAPYTVLFLEYMLG